MAGILEKRWMNFDDSKSGSTWVDEKGIRKTLRKAKFLNIDKVTSDKYFTLLPEYYLRPYEPKFISASDMAAEIKKLETQLHGIFK
jgi:type I restriction enzyme M protein